MPRLVEPALVRHARRHDRDLDRVEHAVAVFEVAEAVPARRPGAAPSSRGRWPATRPARRRTATFLPRSRTVTVVGVPGVEEPVPLLRELPVHAAHGLAEGHRLVDRLGGQRQPAGPSIIAAVTSFDTMIAYSGEVEACIMNAFVEARVRDRARGRRGRGATRPARAPPAACASSAWRRSSGPVWSFGSPYMRVAVAVDRVEAGVAVPRLVEVDAVHASGRAAPPRGGRRSSRPS